MVFLWFFMVLLRFMVLRWFWDGFAMVFYGFAMVLTWFSYGFVMVLLRFMVLRWFWDGFAMVF